MPAPTAYPSLSTILPAYFDELEPDAPISQSPEFVDGGADHNIDADTDIRRFVIRYTGLSVAEFATLRAHMVSARYKPNLGSAYGFDFTPRGASVLANVHYDRGGFTYSHTRTHINSVEVHLIKRP